MKTVVITLRKVTEDNLYHASWRAEYKMARLGYDGWRVESQTGETLAEGKKK